MSSGEAKRSIKYRLMRIFIMFCMWTGIGFFFAVMAYFSTVGIGRPFPVPWWSHLGWALVQYYIWWALTPPILLLVRRFPVDRQHRLRTIPIYILATFFFPLAWTTLFTGIYWMAGAEFIGPAPPSYADFFWSTLSSRFPAYMVFFVTILGILIAADYYRKYQERGLSLTQARLQALRTQLHPHFLFNTLSAISTLVYKDARAADRAIVKLSNLLRVTLNQDRTEEIPLQEELEFLREYLDIHQILLQDRLGVEMKISHEALSASVPSLILQPLVENAIRYGIDPQSRGGRIEISARRQNGMLHLAVHDTGPGLPDGWDAGASKGIGLANTRARLQHLYGAAHRFELDSSPGHGLTVNLEIPFHEI